MFGMDKGIKAVSAASHKNNLKILLDMAKNAS